MAVITPIHMTSGRATASIILLFTVQKGIANHGGITDHTSNHKSTFGNRN